MSFPQNKLHEKGTSDRQRDRHCDSMKESTKGRFFENWLLLKKKSDLTTNIVMLVNLEPIFPSYSCWKSKASQFICIDKQF